jgi:hypothetical protein
MIRRGFVPVMVLLVFSALPTAAQADFGFVPGTTKVTAFDTEGRVMTQAGGHPDTFTVEFELNQGGDGKTEGGEMRDAIIDLPPGFVGNPEAVPECTRQQFEGATPRCPGSSQVGVLRATNPGLGETINPIYHVEPSPGAAAELGFSVFNFNVLQSASVRTDEGYGISVGAPNIPIEITSARAVVWGTPADSSHDPERVCADNPGSQIVGCSTDSPRKAFLTMPTSCSPFELSVEADSRSTPGAYVRETAVLKDAGGDIAPLVGCQSVPFSPAINSAPTTASADSPSGLDFKLSLPNAGVVDPEGIAETEPLKTEVTLPRGVTVNPSAANGIGACTSAQYRAAACPESSKLGTLFANTPLLDEPIEGALYLAAPHDNPFNSLLALYIIARVPNRGILVKQAGEVHADSVTGQLTTTFDHLPPIPYSSFEVKLREGPRAPLITPQICGSYTTQVNLYPFSAPGSAVVRTAPFTISTGANGGNCASNESQLPNHPTFEAGTTTPLGGTYSPFIFKVSRADGSQRFAGVEAMLPPGLTGKLAGIPYCSEAQIAAATARSAEGQGAVEAASPSCPSASQVGIVNVGAGAGTSPYYVQGKAYLAGPYKGAPLSLVIVTPAIAGPFDLGTVVVRTALYVDPFTAQIRAVSDPLPTILSGIPLDVRSVSLQMNRSNFVLNPTSCESMKVTGSVTSTLGQGAALSNRFKVGGCAGLPFKPNLVISLKGATRRAGHPALKAVVTYPKGMSANIARAQVGLPHSEFLDQGSIKTVCKQADLRAGTCPKKSIYGKAKAWTPLLDKPLEGPVYLGVGFGHQLPDLVADLNGQVRILAHGKVDTDKQEGLRNTFEAVPDAPVSKFVLEMQGGPKKGLLENSTNICKGNHEAEVRFTAHNGKVLSFETPVKAECHRKKKGKRGGH